MIKNGIVIDGIPHELVMDNNLVLNNCCDCSLMQLCTKYDDEDTGDIKMALCERAFGDDGPKHFQIVKIKQ